MHVIGELSLSRLLMCPCLQEAVPSSIEFLTLHHLVDQLALHTKNELYKVRAINCNAMKCRIRRK